MVTPNRTFLDASALERYVAALFMAKGMNAADSASVAEVLVWANLRGVDSHGVTRIARYFEFIDGGDMNPAAVPSIVRDSGVTFLMEADRAAGPIAMRKATGLACDHAASHGVCIGIVRNTTHTGAIGRYALTAAERGLVALMFAGGPPLMAYHGAKVPSLSTTPIAIAVPGGKFGPIMLDMATSVVALGKIYQARDAERPIPDDWALDQEGKPTTVAKMAKVLLPIAGAKGSGLALMTELLTGVLGGLPNIAAVVGHGSKRKLVQNAFMCIVSVEAFRSLTDFKADADDLASVIKGLAPREGVKNIMLPAERAIRCEAERRKSGVPLPGKLWQSLVELGQANGVEAPAPRV